MKQLLLFILLIVLAINSQAQRTIDLALDSMYAPDTVYHNVPTYYQFSVRNNGPDTIKPGDTIIYNLIIRDNFNDIYFPCEGCSFRAFPTRNIIAGDTMMISGIHAAIGLKHNFIREYCAAAWATNKTYFSSSSDPNRIKKESSFTEDNNSHCHYIYYKRYNFSISNVQASSQLTLYPNPATDAVNIKLAYDDLKIRKIGIYSIAGQLIKEEQIAKTTVDISDIPNGLYLLQVVTDQQLYTARFIVNR